MLLLLRDYKNQGFSLGIYTPQQRAAPPGFVFFRCWCHCQYLKWKRRRLAPKTSITMIPLSRRNHHRHICPYLFFLLSILFLRYLIILVLYFQYLLCPLEYMVYLYPKSLSFSTLVLISKKSLHCLVEIECVCRGGLHSFFAPRCYMDHLNMHD